MAKHMKRVSNYAWTDEDDALLIELSKRHVSQEEYLAAFPGVIISAIYTRRRKLNLVSNKSKWSKLEDKCIIDNFPAHGAKWDGWRTLLPKRNTSAITMRARILKVYQVTSKRWTTTEDAYIRANYLMHGENWNGWSKLNGRSWSSIRSRASRLGVKKRGIQLDETQRIRLCTALVNTAEKLEVTPNACIKELVRLAKSGILNEYVR